MFFFITTYRIVFRIYAENTVYYILNLLLIADIVFNFMTTGKIGYIRYETFPEIAKAYLKSWFIIDFIAAFPFELIFFAISGGEPHDPSIMRVFLLLQSLALVKLFKAGKIFNEIEESLRIIPAIRRLISVVYWLLMAIHLMALGWILIGGSEDYGSTFNNYLRAIYWVLTTIATIGYGDITPNHSSNMQIGYTIIVELFGVGMFSFIIANVSSLISNLDIAKTNHQHKLDEVNAFLRAQHIPADLQDRVRDYYSYLWAQQRGVSSTSILEDIPRSLKLEILMFLNREVINRVEIFKGADELFIREAVQLLKPRIFLPDEYIIRQREYGDCMYFLASGEVRIVIDDKEITRLGPGSPFGETALIENLHRNASVISIGYSTGYQLNKEDFDKLRARYPVFDRQVRAVSEARKNIDSTN